MMTHFAVAVRLLFLCLLSLSIISCSDKEDTPEIDHSFSAEFSSTDLSVEVSETATISYTITSAPDIAVGVSVQSAPEHGTLSIDEDTQVITFMVGEQTGSGQFTLLLVSQTQSSEFQFNYVVNPTTVTPDPGDGEEDCQQDPNDCDNEERNPYHIYLPSDYLTIFEDETVTFQIQRNYEPQDDIKESFYFNSVSIDGSVSDDKNSLTISANIGEEDTYGEIIAVTEHQGMINESKMYLIYYNKNRDLTSSETPVLATLQSELTLTAGATTNFEFDLYDPDSDRLSYRVIQAPSWISSHLHLVSNKLNVSLTAFGQYDSADNEMIIELSDAHNSSQKTFILTAPDTEVTNQPPDIYIENNIDLSLLVKLTGNETDLITTLTFAAKDGDNDKLSYQVQTSLDEYTYRLKAPYLYVYNNDVSALNHEQITIIANDGQYQSKLTYHLYIKDNFLTFLGGHANSAPLIDVASEVELLETDGLLVPFTITDLEQHDITRTLEFDDSRLQVIFENDNLAITALPNDTETDIATEIVLIATDAFGAQNRQTIAVTVLNNTPPNISFSDEVDLIEGATAEITVTIDDLEDGELPFSLNYDASKFAIVVEGNQLYVTALNIVEDFEGTIEVTAIDSFDESSTISIPANIRFTNNAPVITASATSVSLLPGENVQLTLSYVDPDADELTLFSTVDNSNLTYTYDPNTQILTLAVSAASPYEQNFTFSTSASDGFLTTFENIEVIVPIVPTPPELTISTYLSNVSEAANLIINYQVSDINGDNVTVSVTNPFPTQLTLVEQDGYIEVAVPDNVLVDTPLSFTISARDDSANMFTTSQTVSLNVMPVNDPPEITLSTNNLSLINDDVTSLPLSVVDIDDLALNVEVRTPTSAVVPPTIVVHGADVNSIRISGASKGTVVNNLDLLLRVSDGETYTEVPFVVSVALENEPPVFDDRVDLIQMYENSSLTFNITPTDPDTATDGDVVTVVSVTSDDESLLTIVGDPANPDQNTVTINTLDLTDPATVFISITATDGYVSVLKRVQVNIEVLP